MRRTAMASFGICLGLVLVLFIVLYGFLNMPAAAQGPFPQKFYGAVEIDGQPAPANTVVQAGGEDVYVNPEFDNPITTTEVGKYGGPEIFDAKLMVQEEPGGDLGNGDPIEFYINGMRAKCYDPATEEWSDTFPFQSEMLTELDLFFFGEYTLTATSDGCCPISVTYDTTTATVAAGEIETFTPVTGGLTVTLEAMSDTLCIFQGWEGALVTTANPITIVMTSDTAITATCRPLAFFSLTVTSDGCCPISVTCDTITATVAAGEIETLSAITEGVELTLETISDTCCVFQGWEGALVTITNPITIVMGSDTVITATCRRLAFLPLVLKNPSSK